MPNTLTPQELIAVARNLTHFQSAIGDYELKHYAVLEPAQRAEIERALAALAHTAGGLYASSVQLVWGQAEPQIRKMQEAAAALGHFLQTARKIQQVLDAVSAVADLADSILNLDVEGIAADIDNVIRMLAKD